MPDELKWVITNDFGGNGNVALMVELEGGDYTAYIKWDGCCEIEKVISHGDKEIKVVDFKIHICDVPRFIEVLKSLEEFRMNNIDDAE